MTNDVLIVDDVGMIESLRQVSDWSIKKRIFPENVGGLYYRPIIGLTYYVDHFLFDLTSFWMHFQNILWHLGNVFIVFGMSRTLIRQLDLSPWYPLLAASLFAVHPLATESVNWISGRTDLVAGFFVLLSTWCLLLFRFRQKILWLVLSALSFLLAILTKEVALAFMPGAVLLLLVRMDASQKRSLDELKRFWRNLAVSTVFMAAAGVFFWFRFLGISTNNSQIGNTLRLMKTDFLYDLMVVLRAFGFYMKKLVAPWPLNFTIVEVDPVYELFAVPILIGVVVLVLVKWDLLSGLFAAGVLLFSPAYLIAFNQIAWTPYAERYLYMTTALVAFPAVIWLSEMKLIVSGRQARLIWLILPLVLVVFSVTTFQRNLVWQTNYSILSDSAEKSPYSFHARLGLGQVLVKKGDLEEAEEHLQFAKILDQLWYDERPDIELGKIRVQQERYGEAIEFFILAIERTKGYSVSVWDNVANLLDQAPGQSEMVKSAIYDSGPGWLAEFERPELAQGLAALAVRFNHFDDAKEYYRKVLLWADKNSRLKRRLIRDAEENLAKLETSGN